VELFEELSGKIKGKGLKVVFPEGSEPRILGAVVRLKADELCEPILLGDRAEIEEVAQKRGFSLNGITIINPETYEIIKPEVVGRNVDSLVLGKLSGKHAFIDKLNNLGLSGFDDKKIEQLFAEFKNLADRKKYVLDEDIISLISGDAAEVKGRFSLEHFEIIRTDIKAKAEIIMYVDGEKDVSSSYGSGPVDAAYKAINRLLNDNFVLEEYKLESITGDTDAQAQVVVIIEKNGKRYIGRAQSTDIVEASIKAYINALNRLYQN